MPATAHVITTDEVFVSRPERSRVLAHGAPHWHDEAETNAALGAQAISRLYRAFSILFISSLVLTASFWTSPLGDEALTLAAFTMLAGIPLFLRAVVAHFRKARPTGGVRGFAILAGAVGLAWGAMPILFFAGADADHRLVVLAASAIALVTVLSFGPAKWIALCYLVPVSIGCSVGFALAGNPFGIALACLVPFCAWALGRHCAAMDDLTKQHLIDLVGLRRQNETIRDLLIDCEDDTSDWVWQIDRDGRYATVIDQASVTKDLTNAIEGQPFETVLQRLGSPGSSGTGAILGAFSARKPFRNMLVEIASGDRSRWWRLSGTPQFDADKQFAGYRGIGTDITGSRNSESTIAHLANHDTLTGFANRVSFQDYARRQCAAAASDGLCRALLALDLNGFKSVNDAHGLEGGDEILRQVARRLTATAPAGTFIARLGGDEFALWLQPVTPTKAEAVAQALVEALSVPFDLQGLQIDIGVSVGIAYAPKHTLDPDDLLIKADLALYRAKSETKGGTCVFLPAFETQLIERRKLAGDLKLALVSGEFLLHYQPLVDVSEGRVVGFEALIRWQSTERGFVSPADFIPAAESLGLIAPIGRWVLLEACRAAASWPEDVHVAINVSPQHVRSPDFLQDVVLALKLSGLHPSRLELEVTEGVLLEKSAAALEALKTLRTRGVRIALDDFGTGYSSLNYLVEFPVDKIKIDRSFVRDLVDSPGNQAIVDAIVTLARKLSVRITAEGVETKEQALALKRRRCDELQGYLFSRPRPVSEVNDMIASVPGVFRDALPAYMDSPLAMAFAGKKQVVA